MRRWAEKETDVLSEPNIFFGGWVAQGDVWLDPSEYVADAETAQRLGRERNQIKVWDNANHEEIDTGGTGGY